MPDCLFCNIANKSIPTAFIYEDEQVLAFNDIDPQAPHHVLIIPRQHISTLNDFKPADTSLAGHLLVVAAQLAKKLGIHDSGYRVLFNCNKEGGQAVYHIHLHLLGGRQLNWPPG